MRERRGLTLALSATIAGSIAVVAAVFALQAQDRLVPCELCLKERLFWYAALPLAGMGLILPRHTSRAMVSILAALFVASAVLAAYHVAVEQHWIVGPIACSAPQLDTHDLAALERSIMATPSVQCDVVQWRLFGISMAGWNLVGSAALAMMNAAFWRRTGAAAW